MMECSSGNQILGFALTAVRVQAFESPFDMLTVPRKIEGLKALSRVDGQSALS